MTSCGGLWPDLRLILQESLQQQQQEQEEALKQCREQHAAELKVPLA
jgi:NAD(P)H-nitrite reductase large subunit